MTGLPLVGRLWEGLVSNPKRIERFVKFAIVGTIGAVVDFTVFNIMVLVFEAVGLGEGWNVSASARQIQLAAANIISFSAAVLSNFTWNRLWTFPESRERPLGTQLLQFTIVNITGLLINTLILVGMDVPASAHFPCTAQLQHCQGFCHMRRVVLELWDELDLDLSGYRVVIGGAARRAAT